VLLLALKCHLNVTYGILGDFVGVFFIFSHIVETYNNNSLHHGLVFFSLFCHNLQAAEVVNCKIKVLYVDIQTVLDRLATYPLVAY